LRPALVLLVTLSCTLALSWPAPALADPSSDTEQARQLYANGKVQYEAKDYLDALANFEQSYALTRSTALLFDIAQAHRLAGEGHCAASRRYYRSYLALEPHAENGREVNERLQEIAACADAEEQARVARTAPATATPQAAPSPAPTSIPQVASPHGSTSTVAVLTTGVGAALLLTGSVLYLRARQRFAEARRACPCREGSFSDWEKLSNLSYGLTAVGGAGVAVGGTFWVLGVSRDGPRAASAALSVSGTF